MPALIAIYGGPEPAGLLATAAGPARRQPWERRVSHSDGEIAIGAAGERVGLANDAGAGVWVAIQGELFTDDGPIAGDAAARAFLAGYLTRGERVDPRDGSFAAAIWDERRRRLLLLTDDHRSRPIFVAEIGGRLVAAGELKCLVAGGLAPRIDPQGWAELLAYEQTVAGATPLAGVTEMMAGTTLIVDAGGRREHRRWRHRIAPEPVTDPREALDEFARLVAAAVGRRIAADAAISLSGGLDSRCTAAACTRIAPDTPALTYGAAGFEDVRLGAAVARRAGLPHSTLEILPGYLNAAESAAWLTDGRTRCLHVHLLALREARRAGITAIVSAALGDNVARMSGPAALGPDEPAFARAVHRGRAQLVPDELLGRVLRPAFAQELAGRAEAQIARALADQPGPDRLARFCELQIGMELPGPVDDHIAFRDIFGDRALVEFCGRLPYELRTAGRLQRAYLRRFPRLAEVPSPKDGVAPGLTGLDRGLARAAVRARRRARRTAVRALGPRIMRERSNLLDYATDLRSASGGLLGILRQERTRDRGQIAPEAVDAMIDATLAGRAADTRSLGMLLTLELFQRQMVEGDRPPIAPAIARVVGDSGWTGVHRV